MFACDRFLIFFTAGGAARPGKVVGSVLRYNCGAAAAVTTEAVEQRRTVRNPAIAAQHTSTGSSYSRRNPGCKSERAEEEGIGIPNGVQPKPQYMPRKVAAAHGGPGNNWY